jgi:hypothetical protein
VVAIAIGTPMAAGVFNHSSSTPRNNSSRTITSNRAC